MKAISPSLAPRLFLSITGSMSEWLRLCRTRSAAGTPKWCCGTRWRKPEPQQGYAGPCCTPAMPDIQFICAWDIGRRRGLAFICCDTGGFGNPPQADSLPHWLGAFLIGAAGCADADFFAFINEGRHLHHQAGFHLRRFGDVGNAGALQSWLGFLDGHIDGGRKFDAHWLAF